MFGRLFVWPVSVVLWCLIRINPGRCDPVGQAVSHFALPVVFLECSVVLFAEQGEVVEVGSAAVGPGFDVVSLAPVRWS
jgi:hypothetical protein